MEGVEVGTFACPLCESPMSRVMISLCNVVTEAAGGGSSSGNIGNSRSTNDLDNQKNPLPKFLRKFAKTYGELGGVTDSYLRPLVRSQSAGNGANATGEGRPQTAENDLAFGTDALKSGAFAQGGGVGRGGAESPTDKDNGRMSPTNAAAATNDAGTSPNTPGVAVGVQLAAPTGPGFIDPEKVLPTKLTHHAVLEIVSEAVVLQWQSIQKNGNESMATMLMKACTRKKMSTRTNDYKLKSVLDFFFAGGPHVDSHSILVVFGRVCGILPRSRNTGYPESIRKAWGPITTNIFVIAYCDRCLKMGQLKDGDDNPNSSEVRTKLNKFTHNKTITLKRAFRIIEILMDSNQAHWSMTPFLAAVREYGCRSPWAPESVSRLLHLIYQVSKPHGWESAVPVPARQAQGTAPHPATPKGHTSTDILRDLRVKSKSLWKATQRSTLKQKEQSLSLDGNGNGNGNGNGGGNGGFSNFNSKPQTPAKGTKYNDDCSEERGGYSNTDSNSVTNTHTYANTDTNTHSGAANNTKNQPFVGSGHNTGGSLSPKLHSPQGGEENDGHDHDQGSLIEGNRDRNGDLDNQWGGASVITDEGGFTAEVGLDGDELSLDDLGSVTSESTAGIAKGFVKHDPFNPTHSAALKLAQENFTPPPRMGCVFHGEYDECDYESAMLNIESTTRHISVGDLALACTEAWENECALMQYTMTRALVGIDRRRAIAGTFDVNTISMSTLAERRAMLRILKWYATVFRREVDWAEVRDLAAERKFPFDIPGSLCEKSTAELHNLAVHVASEWEYQQAKEFAEDMAFRAGMSIEDYAARIVNAMHLPRMHGTTGGIDRSDSRGGPTGFKSINPNAGVGTDMEDSVSTLYLGDNYADSADVSLTSDIADVNNLANTLRKRITHQSPLSAEEHDAWRKYRSPLLAPQAYASDQPVRHPLNMVDVLDNDPVLLKKLRLLSSGPIGPNHSQMHMRTIDEEIASVMHRMDKVADADTITTAESISIFDTNSGKLNESEDDNDGQENDEKSTYRSVTGTTSPNEELQVDGFDRNELKNLQELEKKKEVSRRANQVAVAAKGRVLTKIEKEKQKRDERESNKRASRIDSYEERKKDDEEKARRQAPVTTYSLVHIDADVVAAPVSLASALAFEKAVKSLEYCDKQVAPGVVSYIANGYLRPWQLEILENLDLNNANILPAGGTIIAAALSQCCRLSHLNLNGNNIGDTACGRILSAVVEGGGKDKLIFLDLRRNQLTMVTDGLSKLGGLTKLTSLNLAWNCLTVDNSRHASILKTALITLTQLNYLNLSHNRLQDKGLSILQVDILPHMSLIENLDVSGCFITPSSFSSIEAILRAKESNMKCLKIKGNIMTEHDKNELRYVSHMMDRKIIMGNMNIAAAAAKPVA